MTNRPIEVFRAGAIEVAVWENQGENARTFQSLTAKRSYRDDNGDWKEAGNVYLLPQHVPDMLLALQKAHEFVRMGPRSQRGQQNGVNERSDDLPSNSDHQGAEGVDSEGESQPGFAERVQEGRRGGRKR